MLELAKLCCSVYIQSSQSPLAI